MEKRKRIFPFLLVLLLLIIQAALPLTVSAKAASTKPALSKKSISIYKGKSDVLTIKNVKAGTKVKWSSSKKSVATVKANGNTCVITAKKSGSATITAKIGKKSYKCKVTVKNPPVELSDKSKHLNINQSFTLSLNNTKSNVKWSTSNKKVATIKKVSKYRYKVTGKTSGTATITAKVGKKSYKCKVTVKKPTSVSTKPAQPKPSISQVEHVTNPVRPQTDPAEPAETEKSFETEVPTSQTEKNAETEPVQAEKPVETDKSSETETNSSHTEIPAETESTQTEKPTETDPEGTDTEDTDSPSVEIIEKGKVEIGGFPDMTLKCGDTITLNAKSKDGGHFRWESDDPDVATVSQTGTVSCLSKGTVTIYCTSDDGKSGAEISFVVRSNENTSPKWEDYENF